MSDTPSVQDQIAAVENCVRWHKAHGTIFDAFEPEPRNQLIASLEAAAASLRSIERAEANG